MGGIDAVFDQFVMGKRIGVATGIVNNAEEAKGVAARLKAKQRSCLSLRRCRTKTFSAP